MARESDCKALSQDDLNGQGSLTKCFGGQGSYSENESNAHESSNDSDNRNSDISIQVLNKGM